MRRCASGGFLAVTVALAAWSVLGASLGSYVAEFNAADDELYTNAVPNAAAAAFLAANVPRFECPDAAIERAYHFHWWTFRKHLRKTASGWVVTEFLPDVPWAGAENTIVCPFGHHVREGRWLRDGAILRDYMRFMVKRGAIDGTRSYVNWPALAYLEREAVWGEKDDALDLLPRLADRYARWERGWSFRGQYPMRFDPQDGLFHVADNREGMEWSASGHGARPLVNAAMAAEARAIATLAEAKGDVRLRAEYAAKAEALERNLKAKIWNAERGFFTTRKDDGTHVAVREIQGYAPWYFAASVGAAYAGAWDALAEGGAFSAPHGLTTVDRDDPLFKVSYEGHPCQWNGPSWPYTTSMTLSALGNALRSGETGRLSAGDFTRLLGQYAAAHRRVRADGVRVDWIDENLDPLTGAWLSREMLLKRGEKPRERGKDYNHSTFCDLVISELAGFRPEGRKGFSVRPLFPAAWAYLRLDGVPWCGHEVSILWDADGARYGEGAGLTAKVDGRVVAHRRDLGRLDVDARRIVAQGKPALARPDALVPAALGDVRFGGFVARKVEDVIRERMTSDFAKREIVGEARRAFEERSDDRPGGYGYWRGEFWGKLMLAATRAAVYRRDEGFKAWLREEGLRLAALQDADGYLGSYADAEFVTMAGKTRADWCEWGWPSNWNLWCRKYTMWGLLRIHEVTGERRLLDSAARQMDHWIAQMRRRKLSLLDTGNPNINGLASMSVLKPLLALYRETGKSDYLDYAREIVADWDRDDGRPPNLIRNALSGRPVSEWYPNPRAWAKAYEMMSGMDGLLDYVRITGDGRVFAAMRTMVDALCRDEVNVFGGVGYNAMFVGAARQLNAMSEVCDTVHWIKLCQTLFLMTGESRYADLMERAFFNELLAGSYRGGKWAAAAVRDKVRNMTHECQVGMRHNHCCVDNLPRAFFDFAETALTRDADGAVQLNFYSDLEASLGGVRVRVTGGYPVGDTVRVAVENPRGVPLRFRKPGWCGRWEVAGEGTGEVTIRFEMPPRIVQRDLPAVRDFRHDMTDPALMRYVVPWKIEGNEDVIDRLRKSPAATLERGPLLLAKSVRVGDTREQILDPRTVNDGGWSVTLEPRANADVVGAWRAVFTRGDERFAVDVCDYASAADFWYAYYADAFSIWF